MNSWRSGRMNNNLPVEATWPRWTQVEDTSSVWSFAWDSPVELRVFILLNHPKFSLLSPEVLGHPHRAEGLSSSIKNSWQQDLCVIQRSSDTVSWKMCSSFCVSTLSNPNRIQISIIFTQHKVVRFVILFVWMWANFSFKVVTCKMCPEFKCNS